MAIQTWVVSGSSPSAPTPSRRTRARLLVVPHDELGEGEQNEELYLVVEGRARFVCDGETVELGRGEVLYARPGVRREAVALETPTMLFIVGGRPGKAYSPPIWATDWRG